jgi:hypothetical protein
MWCCESIQMELRPHPGSYALRTDPVWILTEQTYEGHGILRQSENECGLSAFRVTDSHCRKTRGDIRRHPF